MVGPIAALRCTLPLLILAVVLSSCAPVRPRLGETVSQSFADGLMQEWLTNASRINSLQGLANFNLRAPLNNLQGTQVILAAKPDRLRAETLSPFGAPLLLLVADGETLGVLLPAQNLYYSGTATPANLSLFLHMPLRPADLVGVLLYQPPLLTAWREESFTLEEGGWLLVRHATLQRQELVFNASRQLVEVSFYESNDLVLKITYGQFDAMEGFFPRRLALELVAKKATLSLEFSDLETNRDARPGVFSLSPPAGATVVYLPDDGGMEGR